LVELGSIAVAKFEKESCAQFQLLEIEKAEKEIEVNWES